MLELLIILIIISLGVVLYGITYQILNFNHKQEAEVIIQYVEPKNCPDCNVECPKLEACEECPKCPQEECPTCPQEEQLSRAQLKQAMMSQLADELTASIAQENPEVFKEKMHIMTLQILTLINLAQNSPETLKAQIEPMMTQLATGLTAKLAQKNPEALKAQMEEMMPLLVDELNLAQNNPDSFKAQIESMASLIVDGPNNDVAAARILGKASRTTIKTTNNTNKFGTENIGKLGAPASTENSMVWTDISYWALDESDNIIIVASFHDTYYNYIKITFDGTFEPGSGKYEYTAASGQNNGVAPSAYTDQSQLVSDYDGATDVVGSTRDFQKGANFYNIITGLDQTNEPSDNTDDIIEPFESKEQYTSKKWCSFGEEGVQLLPTIKPFESLKD
jgi:hypothetical protein